MAWFDHLVSKQKFEVRLLFPPILDNENCKAAMIAECQVTEWEIIVTRPLQILWGSIDSGGMPYHYDRYHGVRRTVTIEPIWQLAPGECERINGIISAI